MQINHWGALLLLALCAGCASAQHHEPVDWRELPHHFSVLTGATIEEEESGPTIGLDYEYRVSDFVGLGGVVEYASEDIDATTVLAVADLHLTHQFILQTGPGFESRGGGDTEFVYRLGVLYEWEWGGRTLSPQLHYDATSGEDAVVLALAVGVCF